MTTKKKLWIFLGTPTILVGLYALNNLWDFYKYWQVKDTLNCDGFLEKATWTAEHFLCFTPHYIQGTIWLLALVTLILTLLLRYSRKH